VFRQSSLLVAGVLACLPLVSNAVELRATGDTFTDATVSERNVNKGALRTVRVRGAANEQLGLIQFNPSQIAQDAIRPAMLRLLVEKVTGNTTVTVHRVDGAWGERTVTHNTRPPITSSGFVSFTVTAADVGQVIEVEISELMEQWRANPSANFGLALRGIGAGVFFVAREGGAAPTLTFDTRPPENDNEVTVAKSGGDYTNPVDAANNAYSGDTWCQNPDQARPCRINIAAGIFVLPETLRLDGLFVVTGAGKDQTILVADNGIVTAVDNTFTSLGSSGTTLSELTIVNHQPGTAQAVGFREQFGAALEKVAIRASGATSNFGILSGDSSFLRDCEISASGGQDATAVSTEFSAQLERSFLSATGASLSNTGITYNFSDGVIFATDSQVVAVGGFEAVAVGGSVDWTGGEAIAIADNRAVGIEDRRDGRTFLRNARVIARGGTEGTGITMRSIATPQEVTNSIIEGSTTGLVGTSVNGARYELGGSQITGGDTAIRLQIDDWDGDRTVISNVVARGTNAIVITLPMGVTIANSILAGQREYAASDMSCTNVYDENYNQLDSNCQ
jgi:hypothetical protein